MSKAPAPHPSLPAAETSVRLVSIAKGGVVFDADLVRVIGETLCERHYGKEELERQRPLLIEDKGDF